MADAPPDAAWPSRIEVVDSHTEGEPTRVVVEGWPQPEGATMAERRAFLLRHQDHLRQAVSNLVTNALRHTPSCTPIEVSAVLGGDGQASVRVRDHGPGLDATALAHAFDRFWQGDASRAEAGTGLGLSIVAAIAHEHGGTATVTNAEDGDGGAIFTLGVPTV